MKKRSAVDRKFPLVYVLFFLSSMVMLIVAVIFAIFINDIEKEKLKSIQTHLRVVAQRAATYLTVEELDLFHTMEDMQRPEWDEIRTRLQKIAEESAVLYVYYWRYDGGDYIQYIIDNDEDEEYMVTPDLLFALEDDPFTAEAVVMITAGESWVTDLGSYTEAWDGLLSAAVPIFNHDGTVYGAAGVDISDEILVSMQSNIRIMRFALIFSLLTSIASGFIGMRSYNKKAIAFNESKKMAEEATLAKSKFLATMSHEIRTPMNAIIGISDIELENDTHLPEVLDSFDRINNSGKALLGIINDILDLSKVETGKMELMPVEYETAGLINDTARLNIMRIGSKPIEFVVEVAETIPSSLIGDDLRIKQILNNILSNSIKYTSEGTVTLKVDCSDNVAPINTITDYGYAASSDIDENKDVINLIFTVSDTGQGMTKEQLATLYDEYAMFNQEANRKIEGTGLGMSITKNLVQLMKGKMEAESEPGVGTIFKIYLSQKTTGSEPIGKELAESLSSFEFTNQMTRAKLVREYMPYGSILIVDDVDANIFVAKGLMKPYGFEIDTASSGYEVLDKTRGGGKYDVIFMDHMMPGMDGVETTKILREEGYDNPIVALTANAIAGMKEFFVENGFNDFVSKPIDLRQLNHVLNIFIRDKQTPEVLEDAKRQKEAKDIQDSPADGCRWAKVCPRADVCQRFCKTGIAGAAEGGGVKEILSKLGEIPGLDVEPALNAMNGMEDVYVDTVKLTVRLLPERIERMDNYIVSDIKSFSVEVHGLKSVLKNIGSSALGNMAAGLERAALENDTDYCNENYPPFKAGLTELELNLNTALKSGAIAQGDGSLVRFHRENRTREPSPCAIAILADVKAAAEAYDRDRGLELISPYADSDPDEDINKLLENIIYAFEAFDCEGALNNIIKLEELLSI